jgi:hypothetical protein
MIGQFGLELAQFIHGGPKTILIPATRPRYGPDMLHVLPHVFKQMTTPMFIVKTRVAIAVVRIVVAREILRGCRPGKDQQASARQTVQSRLFNKMLFICVPPRPVGR